MSGIYNADRTLKQCRKCGEWYPPTDQYFGRSQGGYITSPCLDCKRKANNERRWAAQAARTPDEQERYKARMRMYQRVWRKQRNKRDG